MNPFTFFERIYIRMDDSIYADIKSCNLESLIDKVAIIASKDENGIPLVCNGNVCRGRAQAYIVREANRFVGGLDQTQADEDMKGCVSRRQLRKLVRTFQKKETCISGYALVILHVMYSIVVASENNNEFFQNTKDHISFLAIEIYNAVSEYHNQYEDDEVAHFLLECFSPLIDELANSFAKKTRADFPPIPRKYPDEVSGS